MKILTWNVNGIRSLPESVEKTLLNLDADICCFQETKITRDVLESQIALIDNYNSYFSFCRKRNGYSGVVTYCKNNFSPVAAEEGLTRVYSNASSAPTLIGCYPDLTCFESLNSQLKSLDGEGRVVTTKHAFRTRDDPQVKYLHIVNVYCPRNDPERPERRQFKLDFYNLLKLRLQSILKLPDHYVLVVGDLNCSHKRIDHCDPDEDPEFDQNESRLWMKQFLWNTNENPNGLFVDMFRQFYPNEKNAFTCWNTRLSARETNYGTRIDYVLADLNFFCLGLVKSIKHCTDIFGSDHCPVVAELDLEIISQGKLPDLCSKFMPEFRGVQQKLTDFFTKKSKPVENEEINKSKKVKLDSKNTTLLHFWGVSETKSSSKLDTTTTSSTVVCSESVIQQDTSSSQSSSQNSETNSRDQWKNIFNKHSAGKRLPPLCSGHNEPCVLRTVKKSGPNLNRQFYCCARPQGTKDNENARCQHFQWTA